MKTLALLALALTLTGCAALNRPGCLGGGIPTDPLGAAVLVVGAASCMAVAAWRDRPADPAPPLPAPLAEHPPITATNPALHD